MRHLTLVFALLTLAACSGLSKPDVEIKPGYKALIGTIRIEDGVTAPEHQQNSLSLDIAPVQIVRTPDGKLGAGTIGSSRLYMVKSAWEAADPEGNFPFFIPLHPGLYAVQRAQFQYGGNPVVEYNIRFGPQGVPLIVSNKSDATYIGRLVIKVNKVDMKTRSADMDIRMESEPKTREEFLAHHPGFTVREVLLPIKTSSTTPVSPTLPAAKKPAR